MYIILNTGILELLEDLVHPENYLVLFLKAIICPFCLKAKILLIA